MPRSGLGRQADASRHVTRLTIGEVAARLHTAPSTIRSWEQRLGYPRPVRSTSGRRLYDDAEIALLGDALGRGLSISSAIREIHAQTGLHEDLMRQALAALDFDACDELLEAAIAMRGVSRAFDETVLAAVETLATTAPQPGVTSLAVGWTHDRACWGRRQAGVAARCTVVVVDGSVEGSATRAASCVLQLQLSLRSARPQTLVGTETAAHRSVARRLHAYSIVFVGTPPPSACRGSAILPSRVASFRADAVLLHPAIETLPCQPRLAAEHVLCSEARVHPAAEL